MSKAAGWAGLAVLVVVWVRATTTLIAARGTLGEFEATYGPIPFDEDGRLDHTLPEIVALCDAVGATGPLGAVYNLAGWFLFPLLALAWCYCSALSAPARWPRLLLWSCGGAVVTALLQLAVFAPTIAQLNRILG